MNNNRGKSTDQVNVSLIIKAILGQERYSNLLAANPSGLEAYLEIKSHECLDQLTRMEMTQRLISGLLNIEVTSNQSKELVVSSDRSLRCLNLGVTNKDHVFKSGDSIFLVAMFAKGVDFVGLIHSIQPEYNMFNQTIFDGLFKLNPSTQEKMIYYLLSIDNDNFIEYLKSFGYSDKLDDPIIKYCLQRSIQQSKDCENNNPDFNVDHEQAICSPEAFIRFKSADSIITQNKIIKHHLDRRGDNKANIFSIFGASNEIINNRSTRKINELLSKCIVKLCICGLSFYSIYMAIKSISEGAQLQDEKPMRLEF